RLGLNPDPAQQQNDVPFVCGERLNGIQHKYDQTVLFFPAQGQTCHGYCTFCFRWPQFCGMTELKFSNNDIHILIDYIKKNEKITNILFTGGDPMTMKTSVLEKYIKPLVEARLPNLNAIRIGTKSLVSWPYRYTADPDAKELIDLFKYVVGSGIHLAVVAHINHPVELSTEVAKEAVGKINRTGAVIRAQSPLLRHINAETGILEKLWKDEVNLGIIPYYLFIPRDTSAQEYFGLRLEETYEIFNEAYKNVSGLAKTVRGPVMSTYYGKIQLLGTNTINGKKYFCLLLINSANGNNVNIPFFAEYNSQATWFKDLKPAFGQPDFFPPTISIDSNPQTCATGPNMV
ncbi:MAG TPA: lysine 2,3-aminomutase, partial [Planctomycetota bacterium]|nr:lysine 2,3-aminomutase [Planctomycetota bacterium]